MLNVRLKFCTIPPRLKSLLKLPTDRHLLQQLEQCIRKLLSSEKEPDVCTAVREVRSSTLLCSVRQHNKQHHRKVQLSNFYLNGYT